MTEPYPVPKSIPAIQTKLPEAMDFVIADGVPHMTYQHPGIDINFAWDGDLRHPVLVCPGGYGEEATACFNMTSPVGGFANTAALEWLFTFQIYCEAYLARKEMREQTKE